jgi:hypothetical protein
MCEGRAKETERVGGPAWGRAWFYLNSRGAIEDQGKGGVDWFSEAKDRDIQLLLDQYCGQGVIY